MRQSARMRMTAVATVVGAATVLAPALNQGSSARAQEGPMHPASVDGSGTRLRGQHLRAIASRALDDSIAAWKQLIGPRSAEIASVNLRFVARLGPSNCYGLYSGEGPAYCSGNQTVFVGTHEANRLMARFGAQGEAAITFLIGHEMGHHIQNIYGRFQLLNHVIARVPGARVDLVRRFELEADCYAGVWINASPAWAKSARFRSDLLTVLASIGDDTIMGRKPDERAVLQGVHGTSEQRKRWFLRGVKSGNWRACDVFSAASR
jgi:predicted metalloprotease